MKIFEESYGPKEKRTAEEKRGNKSSNRPMPAAMKRQVKRGVRKKGRPVKRREGRKKRFMLD